MVPPAMRVGVVAEVGRNREALRAVERAAAEREVELVRDRETIDAGRVVVTEALAPPEAGLGTADELASRLFALRPHALVVVSSTSGSGFVVSRDGRVAVGIPFLGAPPADDPRATFAIIDSSAPSAELVRVPWRLAKHVRKTRRAIARGKIDAAEGVAHLGALLGRKPPPEQSASSPNDAGEHLLAKLLARRAYAVYAEAIAPWPEDSVEHVHDLRVATRRFREALALASPLLDRKSYARTNRRARNWARALGERRMVDVFLEDVAEYMREHALPENALPSLIGELEARRAQATKAVHRRFPPEKLLRHGLDVRALIMKPKKRRRTLGELAPAHLESRIAEVEALLGVIEHPHRATEHHELRIAFKHLRYAGEILELDVTGIRALQDALGELNDTFELLAIVRGLDSYQDPLLRGFEKHLEHQSVTRYEFARDLLRRDGAPILRGLRESV